MPELTSDDRAKPVVDGAGNEIGIVAAVEDGTASVDPVEDLGGEIKSKLGWGPDERSTYPLRDDAIGEVTDEVIRLRADCGGG